MTLAHLDPFTRHPLVFLTVCTAKRAPVLANENAHSILRALWRDSRSRNGWCVGRYVVMPDHIHLFAMPDEHPVPLGQWVARWKSMAARQIVAATDAAAPVWQRGYFDRYLRTTESYSEKWDYVRLNPVRAGLVTISDDWPFQGVINHLGH